MIMIIFLHSTTQYQYFKERFLQEKYKEIQENLRDHW